MSSGRWIAAVFARPCPRPREHGLDVDPRAQAASDGQRHEALLRGRRHDVAHDAPPVARGGDVEEDELIGPWAS